MIWRALVAKGVGIYYAVRLVRREFLKSNIDIGQDVYTPLYRCQSGGKKNGPVMRYFQTTRYASECCITCY